MWVTKLIVQIKMVKIVSFTFCAFYYNILKISVRHGIWIRPSVWVSDRVGVKVRSVGKLQSMGPVWSMTKDIEVRHEE